jgi:hypothetical protein
LSKNGKENLKQLAKTEKKIKSLEQEGKRRLKALSKKW